MKQPELGQKILELRKAKGMTQEELVERCNINVRTIQRIEAGEVTPRSFTIKTILDALGYDYTQVAEKDSESNSSVEAKQAIPYLKVAFYVGIAYLLLAFAETMLDYTLWDNYPFTYDTLEPWFISIKALVMVTFTVFIFGFYKLSFASPNTLLRGASIMLMAGNILAVGADIYGFYSDEATAIGIKVSQSILFGALYIVFSLGVIKYQTTYGSYALVTGLLGMASGLALLTVILALPGLVVLTVFEILLLVFLYQSSELLSDRKDPAFTAESPQEASFT